MRLRPLLVTVLSMLAGVTLAGTTTSAAVTPAGVATPASSDVAPAGRLGATAVSSAAISSPTVTVARSPRAGPVFTWPLDPPHSVLRPFEAPAGPYGPGHRGIDLGGTPGQPVRATAAGTVVFAGQVAGRGVISVDHDSGLRTTYEPVTPSVTAGQRVAAGEVLGQLLPGHPGCPAAACLHWGVRRGGEYLDPLGLLRTGRVRLLPWED